MAMVKETFQPRVVGVNTTVTIPTSTLGGFLAKTSGFVTVRNGRGAVLINAVPVTLGVFTPMPFAVGVDATFQTTGGASGTLAC